MNNEELIANVRKLNTIQFAEYVENGGVVPSALKSAHATWLKENRPEIVAFFDAGNTEAQLQVVSSQEEAPHEEVAAVVEEEKPVEEAQTPELTEETGIIIRDAVLEEREEEPMFESDGQLNRSRRLVNNDLKTSVENGAPNIELPGKNKQTAAQLAVPPTTVRNVNALGLSATKEDDCYHLNLWKGGCCTINGNSPCTFLGGNQKECTIYLNKEVAKGMRRQDIPKVAQ